MLSEDYFRWLYTAITRAKNELVLINPPQISLGSQVNILVNGSKVLSGPAASDMTANQAPALASAPLPIIPAGDDPFIFMVKHALQEFGVREFAVTEHQYLKRLQLKFAETSVNIDVFYNGKGRITRVMGQGSDAMTLKVRNALQQLVGANIFAPATQQSAPPSGPTLSELIDPKKATILQRLQALSVSHGLRILNVSEEQYRLTLLIQDDLGKCEVQLYFKQDGRLSTCQRVKRRHEQGGDDTYRHWCQIIAAL